MEPMLYVMAIMGCGDAGDLCAQARVDPARYTSMQACQAAAPAALQRHSDLDFPEIAAQCRATGMRIARQVPTRPRG